MSESRSNCRMAWLYCDILFMPYDLLHYSIKWRLDRSVVTGLQEMSTDSWHNPRSKSFFKEDAENSHPPGRITPRTLDTLPCRRPCFYRMPITPDFEPHPMPDNDILTSLRPIDKCYQPHGYLESTPHYP